MPYVSFGAHNTQGWSKPRRVGAFTQRRAPKNCPNHTSFLSPTLIPALCLLPPQVPRCCASCRTQRTPLWRDAEDGTPLCNACGIRLSADRMSWGGVPQICPCLACVWVGVGRGYVPRNCVPLPRTLSEGSTLPVPPDTRNMVPAVPAAGWYPEKAYSLSDSVADVGHTSALPKTL